jgi:type IV pilus assembly protein PilE
MELMIVLIIVAILVALAYPSYIDYVRKAKRGEAQQRLLNWAINQEIWRSNNTTYNGITNPDLPGYIIPDHDDYTFTVGDVTAATYTLTADALGDQENDSARDGTPCDAISLDESGDKLQPPCWE